jgi:hypothetical protein
VVALVCATAVAVRTRLDVDSTRRALTDSRERVVHLDAQIRDAQARRTQAAADLAAARATLATDTGTRDRLRETDRLEYARLTAALADLARHRAEVTTDTARAQRLDACLLATSQLLNEAAVGDTAHLGTTLPSAARLCNEAAAA